MPHRHDPRANSILEALPAAEFGRLSGQLALIQLPLGMTIHESGTEPGHIFFPVDSTVALLHVLKDGATAEIAMVGSEGAIGLPLFMGGGTTSSRAVVQSGGSAYRLSSRRLKAELNCSGTLLTLLLRYALSLIGQAAQTAICNRHHTLDQQLCRWLLLSLDRVSSNALTITQESIANLLGVRREGVSVAACKLQSSGVIRCQRGQITVLDRARLETLSCECYAAVRAETDRLLTPHFTRESHGGDSRFGQSARASTHRPPPTFSRHAPLARSPE